jgi:hypothetical protein
MERVWFLFAEGELYRGHGGASQYMLWVTAVAAVALAIVGFYLWNAARKLRDARKEEGSPGDLLADLCKIHELNRVEQALISTIAQKERLAQPASLFIDPDPLDRAADGADPDAPRYRGLRQKLFGIVD